MKEYIEKEAFKQYLLELKKQVNEIMPGQNVISGTTLSELIDRFPSAADVAPRWIPVSEWLPVERLSVLVWCPAIRCVFCAYRNEDKWWIFGASHTEVLHDVTAWMSVPDPHVE